MNFAKQLLALDLLFKRPDIELYKKYPCLNEEAKKDLLENRVFFALSERRNNVTDIFMLEERQLLANHFKWVPEEYARRKRTSKIKTKGINEYFSVKPVAEVERILKEEFRR